MSTDTDLAIVTVTDQLTQKSSVATKNVQDSCSETVVKQVKVLLSRLENLKAFGSTFANIEISSHVKDLVEKSTVSSGQIADEAFVVG